MKLNISLLLLIVFLIGCQQTEIADGFDPRSDKSSDFSLNSLNWDFGNSSNYNYDSSALSISNGVVTLNSADTSHSGSDFNNGTHIGTELSDNKVTFKSRQSSIYNVETILSSKANQLASYFRFDNSYNDSKSAYIYNNVTNTPTFHTSSKIGTHALSLTGASIVHYTNAPALNTNFSQSIWIKVNNHGAWDRVISKGDTATSSQDWVWVFEGTGRIAFTFYGASSSCATGYGDHVLVTGKWYHYAVTYDGSTISLYENGYLKSSSSCTNVTERNSGSDLVLGSHVGAGGNYYDGYVDEFAIWNVSLSETEVRNLYSSQARYFNEIKSTWIPSSNNLLAHWPFDGHFNDTSGNDKHLVRTGTGVTFAEGKVGTLGANFDGSAHVAQVANDYSDFSNGFTVGGWVRPTVAGNWQEVMRKGDGTNMSFQVVLQSNDRFFCRYINSSTSVSVSQPATTIENINYWRHVMCSLDINDQKLRLYVDGKLVHVANTSGLASPSFTSNIYATYSGLNGTVDELAIWSTGLSAAEISELYHRQKQFFGGVYTSPVINNGSSKDITGLNVSTTLPFMKELTSKNNDETTSSYSSLVGTNSSLNDDDLMTDIAGIWHFNEDSYNGTANEVVDSSGNNAHGNLTLTSAVTNQEGVHGNYLKFEGSNTTKVEVNSNLPTLSHTMTLSFWLRSSEDSNYTGLFFRRDTNNHGWAIQKGATGTKKVYMRIDTDAATNQTGAITTSEVIDGYWHHLVFSLNNGVAKVYVDGNLEKTYSYSVGSGFTLNPKMLIGWGASVLTMDLDEVALWDRALSDAEVLQVFRRSGNRIKYQVRTCSQSDCSDNPIWKGPGGDGQTSFSELYNRDNANLSSDCTTSYDGDNTTCIESEFTFSQSPKLSAPSFTMTDFPLGNQSGQYWQYRVLLEADDNESCSGLNCFPELESITVLPLGGYNSTNPTIQTLSPIAVDGVITSVTQDLTGTCTVKYQYSKDGNNFYYYNGTQWVSASNSSETNSIDEVSANLNSFAVYGDTLYAKIYLVSDGTQSCELRSVSLITFKDNR